MDLGPIYHSLFNKSMDFIRRLNRENFYFSSQIWWQISGIEVRKTHKISAQYLKNNAFEAKKTVGHGV